MTPDASTCIAAGHLLVSNKVHPQPQVPGSSIAASQIGFVSSSSAMHVYARGGRRLGGTPCAVVQRRAPAPPTFFFRGKTQPHRRPRTRDRLQGSVQVPQV
uniref:Uncharacterized protein n=1 Tax=Eutreptiella gymnastica TaxID=73025 RepID=A0A7S4G545_9EUGL